MSSPEIVLRVDEVRVEIVTGPTIMDRDSLGFSSAVVVALLNDRDCRAMLDEAREAGGALTVLCARLSASGRILDLRNVGGGGISILLALDDLEYLPQTKTPIVTYRK